MSSLCFKCRPLGPFSDNGDADIASIGDEETCRLDQIVQALARDEAGHRDDASPRRDTRLPRRVTELVDVDDVRNDAVPAARLEANKALLKQTAVGTHSPGVSVDEARDDRIPARDATRKKIRENLAHDDRDPMTLTDEDGQKAGREHVRMDDIRWASFSVQPRDQPIQPSEPDRRGNSA